MFDNHSFNPRTREGATRGKGGADADGYVSIHAPVRVRQFYRDGLPIEVIVSIHAPVRGDL